MRRILFRPIDIEKWFILGFSAFLASLLDGGGGGGGSGGGGGAIPPEEGDEDLSSALEAIGAWIMENLTLVISVGVVVLLIILAIAIALLWVSSRGKFMFLDNVVHNRARVRAPWVAYRAEGNSLFWWRFWFGILVFLGFALVFGVGGLLVAAQLGAFDETSPAWTMTFTLIVIADVLLLLFALVVVAYIQVLLEDFVIPLMYRHRLTTNQAWSRFLALHGTARGHFILYALWKLLLLIAAIACIVSFGLLTCCIGFLLLAIPYISSVLLLPVSVFFRLLGPEYLRRFGDDFDVLTPEPVAQG